MAIPCEATIPTHPSSDQDSCDSNTCIANIVLSRLVWNVSLPRRPTSGYRDSRPPYVNNPGWIVYGVLLQHRQFARFLPVAYCHSAVAVKRAMGMKIIRGHHAPRAGLIR